MKLISHMYVLISLKIEIIPRWCSVSRILEKEKKKLWKSYFILRTLIYTFLNVISITIHWIWTYPFAYFCLGRAAYLLIKWLHSILQTAWILLLAVLVFAHLLKALGQHCGSQLTELICWHMFCTPTSDIHSVSI